VPIFVKPTGVTRGPRPERRSRPFPLSAFVSRPAFVQIFVKPTGVTRGPRTNVDHR
jgi:hypothetical protein